MRTYIVAYNNDDNEKVGNFLTEKLGAAMLTKKSNLYLVVSPDDIRPGDLYKMVKCCSTFHTTKPHHYLVVTETTGKIHPLKPFNSPRRLRTIWKQVKKVLRA